MRSDRDKRSDTEREIDDFLSKFESPVDELSDDYSSYLDESSTAEKASEHDPDFNEVEAVLRNTHTVSQSDIVKPAGQSGGNKFNWKSIDHTSDIGKLHEDAAEKTYSIAEAAPSSENTSEEKKPAEPDAPETSDLSLPEPEDFYESLNESETAGSPVMADSAEKSDERPDEASADAPPADKHAALPANDGRIVFKRGRKSASEYEEEPEDEPGSRGTKHDGKAKRPGRSFGRGKAAAAADNAVNTADRRTFAQALFCKKNPAYIEGAGDTYTKDGKTIKNKKYRFSVLMLLRDLVLLGLAGVLCVVIYLAGIIVTSPHYDFKDVYSAVDTSSTIYDDQGAQIDTVYYTENRKVVKYSDMPQDLVNAFVAIEDKTFWTHHGFNWTRMIGAILSSLTGNGRISGTSTITQQLARNVYLSDTKSVRSIKRKLLEMYYAMRLEHALSKEEIAEAYLNTIYLGHGCYGVNAAAKTYFSKSVKDLDLIECAALAAMPQSPDTYALLKLASEAQDVKDSKVVATEPDTIVTNDISKERRQLVLDLMLGQGLISQSDHDAVYSMSLNDFINPTLASTTNTYSYFHEYLVDTVIADLQDQYNMSYEDAERMVYTKGLKIYSTVDSEAQKIVMQEFQDESNFPSISAIYKKDSDGNILNNEGQIALYDYNSCFDEDGNFTLSGSEGDVTISSDGNVIINKDHKLHIYETETDDGTDYSLEFRSYYIMGDDDILYSISGGYINIPSVYKEYDSAGLRITKEFFEDPEYEGYLKIDGDDVIITEKAYTLSPRTRQPQAAMTIVGVGTGEVKAMAGGRQFGGQRLLNRSLNARQPGSSIKPLAVYGAALQKSFELEAAGQKWTYTDYGIDQQGTKGWGDYITVHSSVEDEKTKIEGKYWPENFNHSYSGPNTFKTAIQKSINTCAVKILLQLTADYSVDQLKKFGLTTVQDDTSVAVNDVNPAALALGAMTQGVMPLEMALAYASFPGGGKVNTPICYYKVEDKDGKEILTGKSEQTEALDEGVAWIMADVLRSVVKANGYMSVSGVQPGGKTGTTNDQYDIWFDGFTPSYAASLWIGTDENIEMSSMSTPAAALWGKIINQISAAKEGEYAAQPANVIQKGGEYFTSGTETGLTSWSSKEAKQKAKAAAYAKWKEERKNHRHKVVDQEGGCTQQITGYTTETYTETEQIGSHQECIDIIDENGNPAQTCVDVPDYGEVTKTREVPVYGQVCTETTYKWEYDVGWRDGDFSYDDD